MKSYHGVVSTNFNCCSSLLSTVLLVKNLYIIKTVRERQVKRYTLNSYSLFSPPFTTSSCFKYALLCPLALSNCTNKMWEILNPNLAYGPVWNVRNRFNLSWLPNSSPIKIKLIWPFWLPKVCLTQSTNRSFILNFNVFLCSALEKHWDSRETRLFVSGGINR